MEVSLKFGHQPIAGWARFATESDRMDLGAWQEIPSLESPQGVQDAASYAKEALRRWRDYQAKDLTADSIARAQQLIQNSPTSEVAMMLVVEAEWWLPGRPAVFADIRRTWSGNLYLEYLSKHPAALAAPAIGFGNALPATFADIGEWALQLTSTWVWWETTDESNQKYEKIIAENHLLKAHQVRDLFVVSNRLPQPLVLFARLAPPQRASGREAPAQAVPIAQPTAPPH